jgi:hypothetical protein
MNAFSIHQKYACRLITLFVFFPVITHAQLISVKSVPVAAVEQFLLVPSQNLGMGGLSIALADPSADPFVNPAKGGRIRGVYLFSAPVFGNITEENGGVRTLPLGALVGSSKWFGGMSLAVQQLSAPERLSFISSLADQNTNNLYAAGLLGTKFPVSGISLAASVSWAELQAMQGVDFLYSRSSRIEQSGHIADYRFGLLREKGRQPSFEMLLLHNRVRMTHDIYYQSWFWEGDLIANRNSTQIVRELDQTDTWGLHVGSMIPLKNAGSHAGLIFTANRKSHPKIPNYELMNIPRDPGVSWAFNFGAGLSHATDSSAVGIDFIFEPIWSHTWADAAAPVRNERGEVIILSGGKTVENYFRFNNALVRLGLSGQGKTAGFQLGLQARFINYHLKQTNFVFNTYRTQKEFWAEWTPSFGLNFNFAPFQICYTGRLTAGTGQPGVEFPRFVGVGDSRAESNFIIAPSGSLTLEKAVVLTHQVSVVVKLQSVK